MTFEDIRKHFGSLTAAAKALNLPITTVSDWRQGVPFGRQCQIQIITGGKLQASRETEGPSETRSHART